MGPENAWTQMLRTPESDHPLCGQIFWAMCLPLIFGGVYANLMRNKMDNDWNTNAVLRARKIHRYYSWLIIAFAQATVATGLK